MRRLVYSRDNARGIGSHRESRRARTGAPTDAPWRPPTPRLPPVLDRPAGLADRDLDAERGAGVARAGADPVSAPARNRQRASVHAGPAPVTDRWRAERPLRQAAGSALWPDGHEAAGARAGPPRLERLHPVLARGSPRHDLR